MAILDFKNGVKAARQLFGEIGEDLIIKWQERVNASAEEPTYYQAVLLTCLGEGIEDCKKRNSISHVQKIKLDKLSIDPLLAEPGFLVDYDRFRDFRVPRGRIPDLKDDKETRLALRNPSALEALFKTTDAIHESFFAILNGLNPIYNGEVIHKLSNSISSFVSDYDHGRNVGLREAKATHNLIKRLSRQVDDPAIAQGIAQAAHLQRERSLAHFLELKLDRVRELDKINPFFAKAYLRYTVIVQGAMDHLNDRQLYFQQLIDNLETVKRFVRKDDELYRAFVDRFDVVEDRPVVRPSSNGNGSRDYETKNTTICHPLPPSPSQLLHDAIVNRHSGEFSADASARVRYFINEDVARYNANPETLKDSFGRFKLGKRLRGMEEVHVRNFFDDITLGYLMHGKTPSSEDLERVYEGCRA